jgi:hypothetical protein
MLNLSPSLHDDPPLRQEALPDMPGSFHLPTPPALDADDATIALAERELNVFRGEVMQEIEWRRMQYAAHRRRLARDERVSA